MSTKREENGICSCVISYPPQTFQGLDTEQRREKVVAVVRDVLTKLEKKKQAKVEFASGTRVEQARLRVTAKDRWDLSGGPQTESFPDGWFTAAELLEMRQGVTPGGCLDVFLMEQKKTENLRLEKELVHLAIKSKQLVRWRVGWKGRMLFYPYHLINKKSEPAFTIQWNEIEDKKLKERLLSLQMDDALDFDQQIDSSETEIVKKSGIHQESVLRLLKHRISLGLIKYPMAATYLVSHYEQLEGRVFEKKKFTEMGKKWYEYHRPRDTGLMLSKPRILSPTLARTVRFVFDEKGYLSDHACLMIQPTSKTALGWDKFVDEMTKALGSLPSKKELLQYCLAFMNSDYAQERLVSGHRPSPKGSYTINESFMKEIPIPTPSDKKAVKGIFKLVESLVDSDSDMAAKLEKKLDYLVQQLLDAANA